MNKLYKILLFLVVLLLLYNKGYSQYYILPQKYDFETWNAINLKCKINKNWDVKLEEQLRFKTYSTEFDRFLTQIEVKYNPNNKKIENFDFGFGLRHIFANDNIGKIQEYENHYRFHLDISHKFKKNNFRFKHRLRFQRKKEFEKNEQKIYYPSMDLRLKGYVIYKIKDWKLDPEISWEFFLHNEIGELNNFTKHRIGIGTDYDINKKQKISISLIKEGEVKVWDAKTIFILSIKYNYTFKLK